MIRCEVIDVCKNEFGVKIEISGNGQDVAREFYAIYQTVKEKVPAAVLIVEHELEKGKTDV